MFNVNMENKVGLQKLTNRRRWLSTRKVWINKIELKHTNDIVVINVHIYDRIYNVINNKLIYYLQNTPSLMKTDFLLEKLGKSLNILSHLHNDVTKLFILLCSYFEKQTYKSNNNTKSLIMNQEIKEKNEVSRKLKQYNKLLLLNIINKKAKLLNKRLGNKIILFYYIQYIEYYILKYKNQFITRLQKIITKLYNKKVVLNIIFLRNYYLNSNVLTQILAHKSKNRDNKVYRTFKKALVNIKIPLFRKNIINKAKKERINQNIFVKHNIQKERIDSLIGNYFSKENVLNRLNNKTIIGVRLESAGRLTRRFTAQRAIKKSKYIGTLKNINSSLKGLPSQMIRNNITSSLQHSKGKSQNRIGSFGIKGWINSI